MFATCLSGPKNLGLSVTSPPLWGLAGSIPAPAFVFDFYLTQERKEEGDLIFEWSFFYFSDG
ncbi:MAG: hypothetical protein V7L21_25435 [Nostoc sp.]|uniref:hypothetical protein n=1 Tax=Nostoc sp. TaxID=1180 RepID=UPI002FF6F7CC